MIVDVLAVRREARAALAADPERAEKAAATVARLAHRSRLRRLTEPRAPLSNAQSWEDFHLAEAAWEAERNRGS